MSYIYDVVVPSDDYLNNIYDQICDTIENISDYIETKNNRLLDGYGTVMAQLWPQLWLVTVNNCIF